MQPTDEPFQWPIATYMILAGTSAGTVITGALLGFTRAPLLRAAARTALVLGAVLIGVGFPFLILDLERPQDFYYILRYFNPRSVISWGARGISLYFGFLIVAAWLFHPRRTPADAPFGPARTALLVAALVLAVFVGLYPGFVLQQGVARPLWNPAALPYLFLTSGLHMGLAVIVLARLWDEKPAPGDPLREDHVALRWADGALIAVQIALLGWYFLAAYQTAPEATARLVRGDFGLLLFAGVMFIGWVLPVADMLVRGARSNLLARCLFVLIGGVCLRILVIHGGQGATAFIGS